MQIVASQAEALALYPKAMFVEVSGVKEGGLVDPEFGSVLVAVDGDGLFEDAEEDTLVRDYRTIAQGAIDLVSSSSDRPVTGLVVDDFEYVDAPRISWCVEARWAGKGGEWGDHVVASSSTMATVAAYCVMSVHDAFADKTFVSATEEIERAVGSIRSNTVFPPIPLIVEPDRALSMLRSVAPFSKSLPSELGEEVDRLVAIADGASTGRRGPEEVEGQFYVQFSRSLPLGLSESLWTAVTMTQFENEVGDPTTNADGFSEFLLGLAKGVASRFVDYEAIGNDSVYLDEIDKFVDDLTAVEVGKAGPTKAFQIDAVWYDDEKQGPWSDTVHAMDTEDAAIQAGIAMTATETEIGEGAEGFEEIAEGVAAHRIAVLPCEVPSEWVVGALDKLAKSSVVDLPEGVRTVVDEWQRAKQTFDLVMGKPAEAVRAPVLS